MKILTKYILKKFLYYFIVVLVALELFFVGMDLLQSAKLLPDSANLQLLYVVYNFIFTLTITLPLSLVFGWLITVISLVKSNELVAIVSLGATSKNIYFAPIITSLIILFGLIMIQLSPLAYSYEQKNKILKNEYFVTEKSDIFFKYNQYFVYFEKLYHIQKEAQNVKIFEIKQNDMIKQISADNAKYTNNEWLVSNATIIEKPTILNWEDSKLAISHHNNLNMLNGFRPKILNTVYEPKGQYSILDAVESFKLLWSQNINTSKIRASLYNQILIPSFIIPIMLLLFFHVNINSRFFRTSQFTSLFVFLTLMIWGAFFLFFKLSSNGVIIPELGLILPLILLWITSLTLIKKRSLSI